LAHIFDAYRSIEKAYDQLLSSTLTVTISVSGLANIPDGDSVTVEVGFGRGTNHTYTLTGNDNIVIDDVVYTDILVQLIHSNGTVLDQFNGIVQKSIVLTAPDGTYLLPEDTSTSSSSSSVSTTPPPTTQPTDTSGTPDAGFVSLSLLWIILPLNVLVIIQYQKRRKQD